MQKNITIQERYKGPPKSGNGGYCCGLMAQELTGAVEASLKLPPPLEKELIVNVVDDAAQMFDGNALVGTAKSVVLELDVPPLPNDMTLIGSPVGAPGRPAKFEPFSTCFVCGHDREHPDGLCLHSEMVEGQEGMVAASWSLSGDYADENGNVRPEIIWSALDCPGYFACAAGEAALLGRLTGEILKPLAAAGVVTVLGWDMGGSGRKRKCGTAVYAADGTLVAKAEGLWIVVDPEKIKG